MNITYILNEIMYSFIMLSIHINTVYVYTHCNIRVQFQLTSALMLVTLRNIISIMYNESIDLYIVFTYSHCNTRVRFQLTAKSMRVALWLCLEVHVYFYVCIFMFPKHSHKSLWLCLGYLYTCISVYVCVNNCAVCADISMSAHKAF